ncbi:peptidase S1 domain-containing protein [Pseudoscourfieldia marina]
MAIGQRTVALFEVDRLQPTPQTSSYKVLRARTVMGSSSQKYPFCQSEQKQVVQPLGAFCSGILLTESLVATAAHCLDGGMAAASQFCSSGRLVFARNYAVTTKTNGGGGGEQLGNVSRSNDDDDEEEGVVQANMGPIARCKEVVAYARGKSPSAGIHLDYAVLRLDKPLLPTTVDDAMLPPLDLVDSAAVFSATNSNLQSLRLLAIGHPSGMPRKYGLDGRWISRIDPEPPIVSSRKNQGDDNGNASPNDVVNLWSRVLTIAQSSALSSSSSTDSSSAAIMTPRKPTRHVVSVDAFRGSSGGPVIAYTNSRVLGLAGILTGGHTYDYLVSDEEPGGCLRTNHCREMVTGKMAAAVRCDDGSLSAGEVMHDASYFAPWIGTEKSSPPPPPQQQSPDDPICNGRGTLVDSEKFTCSCNEGYNGTLCDRIVTQHGCLCDPPDLWPDGPEKMVARMRMRGGGSSTSPASSSSPSPVLQNRDQLCPPTSQLSLRISRCFVDARSCLASPASDPQKAVPFGAIRAPSVAWDYCS